MLDKIIQNINERLNNQLNSRCATEDEVAICWLLSELNITQNKLYRVNISINRAEKEFLDQTSKKPNKAIGIALIKRIKNIFAE